MIDKFLDKLDAIDKNKLDSFYCGSIGFISGITTYFHQIGIDETFIGVLIKTAGVAAVSTLTGLILKQLWYKVFPKKK